MQDQELQDWLFSSEYKTVLYCFTPWGPLGIRWQGFPAAASWLKYSSPFRESSPCRMRPDRGLADLHILLAIPL